MPGKKIGDAFVSVRPELDKQFSGQAERAASDAGTKAGHSFGSSMHKAFAGLAAGIGAAFAAAGIGKQIAATITTASDLNETVSKAANIFPTVGEQITAFANRSSTALGLSKQATLE